MCRLILKAGDRVRNINSRSRRKGMEGVVTTVLSFEVVVVYNNGQTQYYAKGNAHNYLELIEDKPTMEQRLSRLEAMAATTMIVVDLETMDMSKAMEYAKMQTPNYSSLSGSPKRQVLKKVRRNVISGKTQDEVVRDLGHARGVEQFNTRCLGTTSAQALHTLYSAMDNPGRAICFRGIDHATKPDNKMRMSDNMFSVMSDILRRLDWRGFTFNKGDHTVVFNPIVTEETYVEL